MRRHGHLHHQTCSLALTIFEEAIFFSMGNVSLPILELHPILGSNQHTAKCCFIFAIRAGQ